MIDIPDNLTAAEHLAVRNELIACLAEVDDKLLTLARQKATHRLVADFRSLAQLRLELAEQIKALNAEPADFDMADLAAAVDTDAAKDTTDD